MNEDKWPDNFTNPIESDRRGYRCIHCDVDGDSQFCHYHKKQIVSLPQHDNQMREEGAKAERERVLDDVAQYIQKHTHCCSHMPLWVVTKDPLLEFIQSLRHRQTHEQQGTTAGGR